MKNVYAPSSNGRSSTALVAIGANLPGFGGLSPCASCEQAVSRLTSIGRLCCSAVSFWYRSAPVPQSGQDDYVNGVALLQAVPEPATLLRLLQSIEAEAGRIRSVANAARPLDLDILAIDALVLDTPDLVLPHPRLHKRSFVLLPLQDVAPGWVNPRTGQSVAQMIADLPPATLAPAAISRL